MIERKGERERGIEREKEREKDEKNSLRMRWRLAEESDIGWWFQGDGSPREETVQPRVLDGYQEHLCRGIKPSIQ